MSDLRRTPSSEHVGRRSTAVLSILDDTEGTVHGQLADTPDPHAETFELDVSYQLEADAMRLVTIDHTREREAELTRLR